MIITPQNRETVLQIFREYPTGLSISDLSLKCGLNRNKCSQICSDFYKNDIIGLIQKSSYKFYFLKYESVLHYLIDSINDPALVVNRSFYAIGANQEYKKTFKDNQEEILGVSGEDLLQAICPDLIPDLKLQIGSGMNGKTATFLDETGALRAKTLTISLNGSQFCIIILNSKAGLPEQTTDSISTAKIRFTAAIPSLMVEKTWPKALEQIARLLHETIKDTLIFTLLIDEQLKTCTIHSIAIPEPKSTVPGLTSDASLIPLTGIEIFQYKTGEPVTYYTGTPDSLQNTPLPPKIKTLCPDIGISSISLLGISSGKTITSVLGIGAQESNSSKKYESLLCDLSGYLTLLSTVCQNTSDAQRTQEEYQKQYSDIYSLLTEKTQENLAYTTEAEYLRSILGAILDTMQISLIAVTEKGVLISANKTACTTYSIEEQHLENNSILTDVLQPDVATSLLNLIPHETGQSMSETSSCIETQQSSQIHWHLLYQNGTQPAFSYLCIGENHPAPLIKYLKSKHENRINIPGSGRI
jgi:hypothetical protein